MKRLVVLAVIIAGLVLSAVYCYTIGAGVGNFVGWIANNLEGQLNSVVVGPLGKCGSVTIPALPENITVEGKVVKLVENDLVPIPPNAKLALLESKSPLYQAFNGDGRWYDAARCAFYFPVPDSRGVFQENGRLQAVQVYQVRTGNDLKLFGTWKRIAFLEASSIAQFFASDVLAATKK